MKIEYKTQDISVLGPLWQNKHRVYVVNIKHCCEEMEKAWQEDIIGFSDWHEYPQENTTVNLYSTSHDNLEIKYCPFCGEAIETPQEISKTKLVPKQITETKTRTDYDEIEVQ